MLFAYAAIRRTKTSWNDGGRMMIYTDRDRDNDAVEQQVVRGMCVV